MNYLPFKVKGGPKLQAALKNLPTPYRNGWDGDSLSSYYRFDIPDLRLEKKDCDGIEVSPEEFVSKVNSFIKASKFACKGSPELAQLLDTYHEAGLKDFQDDPCISPDKYYFIWENQLFSRPCSETVSIEVFRTYWDPKFDISSVSSSHKSLMDKTKVFVKGSQETKEVLTTLLRLGLLKTNLDTNDFSKEDHYFALGSRITWTTSRNFYIASGLTEITPSEVKARWLQEELTPLKASSAHINMESPKNSKPFGLSQKQTLKIVL